MPIYAYRCTSCGHAQDVLRKVSDPLLTECPACGAATFTKQVTAAGFQLKGSGWYVTDFRDGNKGPAKKEAGKDGGEGADAAKSDGSKGDGAKSDGVATGADPKGGNKAADKGPAAPAAPATAGSASPAAPGPTASGSSSSASAPSTTGTSGASGGAGSASS